MTTEKPYIKVPTWKDGEWVERTIFQTKDEFHAFIKPLFKEPGQYGFDETSFIFNEQSRRFAENKKSYCASPKGTSAHDSYWDFERRKCRRGAIFISGDDIWYLPGFYYMFLNFLQIYHKEEKVFEFAEVRDAQYHIALYITLAFLEGKHAAVIKKRQIAWSYLMMALFISQVWFEEGPVLKMGASLDKHVNNTWKYLTEYRSFLNKYTAWTREFNPGGQGEWEQQVEMKDPESGVLVNEGLKGKISGFSLGRDPSNSVGGPCSIFYYEEAGIAPTMDDTFEFLRPALYSGEMITGYFIAGGSVGDLDQCDPLKDFIYSPDNNDVFCVTHNYMDDKGTEGTTGLFVPEHWSMWPCIDKFGNSKIDEALDRLLNVTRPEWKEKLDPKRYRHRISQHPVNLEEAFGSRKDSRFPLKLVDAQEQRIKDNEYPLEYVDLERNDNGGIDIVDSDRIPITDFPIKPTMKDKRGVLVIKERPQPGSGWGTYLGSIDPIQDGRTTTSISLCTIYIYKNPVEVSKDVGDSVETKIEQDGIVAWWCGRYDDPNDTHELLEMIIELYNAWTLVEVNVSSFITYMVGKRKQRFLIPKEKISFLKEMESNKQSHQKYGYKRDARVFDEHLLDYLINYLKEVIHEETDDNGKVYRTTYGVERIPDIMALAEMKKYKKKLNVDRLSSLAPLIAFAMVFQANTGYSKRREKSDDSKLDKSKKLTKLDSSPFKIIGKGIPQSGGKRRSPFKNIR